MAQKRMFDKSIIETDNFLDLPTSCKALYFLLGMEADDEGFVSPKRVTRLYGGNDDDIKILSAKNFVIPFENGVVVITDWKKNNWLDSRRIKPTEYQKEKQMIDEENGKYVLLSEGLASARLVEYRREEKSIEENSKQFKKPTLKEIEDYCLERSNKVDPQRFFDFYESKGWLVGRNKMKDWEASVRTWEKNNFDKPKTEVYKNSGTSTADKLQAKLKK